MKKRLITIVALVLAIGLVGCTSDQGSGSQTSDSSSGAAGETVSNTVTETDYLKVEGLYVDDTYVNEDNANLKLVYLFYTVSTQDKNLQLSSNGMKMTIDGVNSYRADQYIGACNYMNSYYYDNTLKDVYVGDTLKMVSTFEIPAGDLTPGKKITLANDSIPGMEALLLYTDDMITAEGPQEIAKTADPTGYAAETQKREPADANTVQMVQSEINGYYWEFYITPTSYHLEFFAPNSFEVTTTLGSNSGTYEVTNGYVICTYSNTGNVIEIPYTLGDQGIELDVLTAFDFT